MSDAAICSADVKENVDVIRLKNANFFNRKHIHVTDEESDMLSKCGVASQVITRSDALVHVSGIGIQSFQRLHQDPPLHSQSCILLKESIVLSLCMEDMADFLAERKHEEAEEAHLALSKIYPFSGWKHQQLEALAGHARHHEYQHSDIIFEQGCAADEMFFILEGDVNLLEKGMYHIAPSVMADSVPTSGQEMHKAGLQANARPTMSAITTVTTGGVLGLDIVLQRNLEKSNALALKRKEVEMELAELQKEFIDMQKDAKMSRKALTEIRTKITTLTRTKTDILLQLQRINTDGKRVHKHRAIAATGVVKLISVRRTDVENLGPRGSLAQIDKFYRPIIDHRKISGSDIKAKLDTHLSNGVLNTEDSNLPTHQQASTKTNERRRFLGDIRVNAALAGHRGGLQAQEGSSILALRVST